ncbi:conserved hypothetical protein [Ricinus communis]|uniref:GRF-type domain-containing protein n=1 Tax=Ricinus communis TaxID=3988 RepID=B9SVI1_RICCO|nr:conserved hypothetical protein [Ricinus communis]
MDGEREVPICGCGYGAFVEISNSNRNPGGRFYTCPFKDEQKCGLFSWYNREYSDYQLMYINGLRRELTDLRSEQNQALVQAGEARAEAEAIREAPSLMPNEIQLLREAYKEMRWDIQFLGKERSQ